MKIQLHYFWYVFMLLSIIYTQPILGKAPFKQTVIDKAKKAVVTINSKISSSAYGDVVGRWTGTGFMVNKKQGLLLTNGHVVGGRGVMGTYDVVFYNGKEAVATPIYYDPWLDYAFVKVDLQDIPQDVEEVAFSTKNPEVNQPVFVIGNNEAQGFSVHQGVVSSLYSLAGQMPQHSINLSLNTKGGSSGSPIFDQNGKAIALNYASNATFGVALHPQYIRYALPAIEQGRIPKRKHIGAIIDYYSLDKAVKYANFPQEKIDAYIKKYPLSLNKAIQVSRTLKGAPAEKKLLPGDIIWAVNDKEIGPNLVDLDLAMNNAQTPRIRLQIFRKGKLMTIDVDLYNLEEHKIKKMVNFGGALFFEMDDFWSDINGAPAKSLAFTNAQSGTSFANASKLIRKGSKEFNVTINAFDNEPVNTIDELIKIIPSLIRKKYFTMNYINYTPYHGGMAGITIFSHTDHNADILYNALDARPNLLTFDDQKMTWQVVPIPFP